MTVRAELLHWYDRQRRDLPWRRSRDPYAIWVSEIMLQQTRVETVLPYYEAFLQRFPTVEDLARAEVEEVLALWSGLGYYRRARLLHQAATLVAARGGQLPGDLQGLADLPGIGAYTAAAIGSIAFGIPEPAIDGNLERVVSRLLAIDQDPKKGEGRRRVVAGARELLDEERPGDSNQAMMELGAIVCRPRNPLCPKCPLAASCRARASGDPQSLPVMAARANSVRVRRRVAVVADDGRVLLFRRSPQSGRLAGFWELPWIEAGSEFDDRYPGDWDIGRPLGSVRHSITNRVFLIEVLEARLSVPSAVADGPEAGWFTTSEIDNLPISSLVKKVLAVADRSGVPAGRE